MSLTPDMIKDLDVDGFEPATLERVVVDCRDEDGDLILDKLGDKVTTLVLREPSTESPRVGELLGAFAILETQRTPGVCVGYAELKKQANMTETTFKRSLNGALATGEIVRAWRGHYIRKGVRPFEPGQNYDTSEEERARQSALEV